MLRNRRLIAAIDRTSAARIRKHGERPTHFELEPDSATTRSLPIHPFAIGR